MCKSMHCISWELETIFLGTYLFPGHWHTAPMPHKLGLEVVKFLALGKSQSFGSCHQIL